MGIKAKQVAGVTTLVVVVVMALSAYHVATLVRLNLEETAVARPDARRTPSSSVRKKWSRRASPIPTKRCATDGGIRSMIESSTANWPSVTYVAIVNKDGIAVAHSSASLEGKQLTKQEDFAPLATAGPWKQIARRVLGRTVLRDLAADA